MQSGSAQGATVCVAVEFPNCVADSLGRSLITDEDARKDEPETAPARMFIDQIPQRISVISLIPQEFPVPTVPAGPNWARTRLSGLLRDGTLPSRIARPRRREWLELSEA